jgi:hypothetical protein
MQAWEKQASSFPGGVRRPWPTGERKEFALGQLVNPESHLSSLFARLDAENAGWRPREYDDYLIVKSAHVLVASDVHFPKHDEELLHAMLLQAVEQGVDTLIWAGDFYDMEEFSPYGVDDPTSSFRRNLSVGGQLMRGVADLGISQVWSAGNHEYRVFRNRPLDMTLLARMSGLGDLLESERLRVSDHPLVYLPVGNWIVVHPGQYGSFPTLVATKLATRFQANVVAAHEHHWGMTTDETGQFIGISSGGLFDPRLHKYINYNVTSQRAWQQGWVILHNGQASLYRGRPASTIAGSFRQKGVTV